MSNGKAVNQSKAKHCGSTNEVAGEGHAGATSILSLITVERNGRRLAWKPTPFTCSTSNSWRAPRPTLFGPKSQTRREPAVRPGLLRKWAFDHRRVLEDVFKEDSKKNYVGSVRLTLEKSFALMALRALASAHWADTEMNTGD
ncbi:hypothetical protein NQZ68_033448 [Scomber scombrus]